MKLALVADVHVSNHALYGGQTQAGLNERCRMVLDTLKAAVAHAHTAGATTLVILGDLFDSTRPSPQIITAVQGILVTFPTVVLGGNHDLYSSALGDHALGPLMPVATLVMQPVTLPLHGIDLVCVPYQVGPAKDWLPSALEEAMRTSKGDHRVLALHLGLSNKDTPPWLQGAHDSVEVTQVQELMEHWDIEACYAGNWHRRQAFGRSILQVGALCPTGFDNEGMDGYGTVALHGYRTGTSYHSVAGPRFLKLKGSDPLPPRVEGYRLFVRYEVDADQLDASTKRAQELVQEGALDAVEVKAFALDTVTAARYAATVAKGAGSLAEAVEQYVNAKPMPESIDRASVLQRTRTYLGL